MEKFMRVLRVCPDLPARSYIRTQHVENVMRPALESLGHDLGGCGNGYDGVVTLIANRNKADALRGKYALWLTDPGFGSARAIQAALVEARTIRRVDILEALPTPASRPLLRRWTTSGHERLRVKLAAGGVRSTRIQGALRLREAWLAQWEESRGDLPGDEAARQDLEAQILEIAGDIEAAVAKSGPEWGDRMYEQLRERLRNGDVVPAPNLSLAPEHLFGLALNLSAECEIWFSDEFDVEQALREAGQVAAQSSRGLEPAL
ncbi:hypothetical protein [Micromonospora sp. NPDC004704]